MVKFNPNIPESESRLLSAPIRQNFNALNDRTDQLSISNTVPESTSIIIGRGDKVYFQNNAYTPFTGSTLDLGSASSGVEPFSIANRYKKIIIYYTDTGAIEFVEGPEEETRDLSTTSVSTLMAESSISNVLQGTIPLCCVLVTNNGTPSVRGAINPIFESDLLDIRPFLQRTTDTQLIDDHISATTLAEAHPGAIVSNILLEASTVGISSIVSPTQFVLTSTAEFIPNPSSGYYPIIRFSSDAVPTVSTKFQTAKVLSVVGNTVTIDRQITTSPSFATKGKITLDRMNFDVLEEFEASGLLRRRSSDGYIEFQPTASISLSSVSATTFSGSLSGNASTASTLQTARTVNGVSFNGSSDVLIEPYTIADESTNATRYLAFMDSASDGYQSLKKDSSLFYNPNTNTLTATTFSGSLSGNATNVTGVVAIANGGTGQTTANAGLNALLPSQTSNSNKVLLTDGSNTGWSQIVDAYISPFASISDTKLATIAAAGKVANSATSASTSADGYSIALRDGYGDLSANRFTGGLLAGSNTLDAVGTCIITLPSSASGWIINVCYSDTSSTTTAIRVDSRSGSDVMIKGAALLGFEYIAVKI